MKSEFYFKSIYGNIHYQDIGQGETIIMLHATPRSSESFKKLALYLSKIYRIISIDTIGFGKSANIPLNTSINLIADIKIQLIESLGLKKVNIFGLHTGNKIATAVAGRAPLLVNNLIICGMTHSIILDKIKRKKSIKKILDSNAISKIDIDKNEQNERIRSKRSIDIIYKANFEFDLESEASKVIANTLILELCTEEEEYLGNQALPLSNLFKNGTFKRIDGSDRFFLEKQYSVLGDIINKYIKLK